VLCGWRVVISGVAQNVKRFIIMVLLLIGGMIIVGSDGKWFPYAEERAEYRLESLGERPELDPFCDNEPLVGGVESPEVCESCQ